VDALTAHGYDLVAPEATTRRFARKALDVVEHRLGVDVEKPMRGCFASPGIDVVIALLERYAVLPARAKRLGLPPYGKAPLVMLSVWLAHELATGSDDVRDIWLNRLRHIDITVVLSRTQERILTDLGVSPDRILATSYGVDTKFFSPPTDARPRDIDLLAVGMDRGRDYATLFAALRGSGLSATVVCSPSNLVGLQVPDEAQVLNPVPHPVYRDLLRRAKVVVVPTHELNYPTGQSVALEAAAAGATVVMTDTMAIREYFVDGESAFLVPPAEPAALRVAIQAVLNSPEARARVAETGGRLVRNRFTLDRMWAEIAQRIESRAR
jgi:glycosyltransferase involved in cell wall biosynthesis